MRSPKVKTSAYRLIFVAFLILCTLGSETAVWAQTSPPEGSEESAGYVREVRDIEVGKEGVPNPTGITYLPEADVFLVLEQSTLAEDGRNAVELFFVTSGEDVVGSVTLETSISNLKNVAYDPVARRVLILDAARNELIEVKLGADNLPDPSTMTRVNVQQFGVENPQGMTMASDGLLLILDAVGPRIVQVAPGSTGSFEGAGALSDGRISEIALQTPGLTDARGLAIDPATGHLFILSPGNNEILELTANAEIVSVRDTEEFFIRTPQAMVFAPSGDNTDDPEQMSLYIVHRAGAPVSVPEIGPQVNPSASANQFFLPLLRGGNQATIARTEGGLIKELSFLAPPAIAQSAAVAATTLVQTIYTADFPTPSGDTAGIAYIESSDHFLFNDSEIEEMPTHYKGANIFEITRANPPSLVYTYTTSYTGTVTGFSDEPTGIAYNQENGHLYVVSDDDNRIHMVDPGPDGKLGTQDDIVTPLNTTQYGASDPEDVAYSNNPPTFYIADGMNAEVYVISSGNNGIFDGVVPPDGDDVVTHFDTSVHGITDMEGIGYDSINGTLYIAGGNKREVAEVTTSGALVRLIDVSVIRSGSGVRTPAGIIKAPSSANPGVMSLYITDRGIDNDSEPSALFDGAIYELSVDLVTPGNNPPVVTAAADATVRLDASAHLTGTVTDDGIPASPGVTSLWTKVSGPGNVVFANNAAPSTTATFSALGTYVLRLAANDGELGATADVSISVTATDGTIVLESRVSVGSDDAEEVVANGAIGTVLTTHTDLALGNDGPTDNLRRMLVGIRFPGLTIPKGATITKAYIQFTVDQNDNSLPHSVLVEGQGSDNPATFATTNYNLSLRPRTVATVTWSIPAWPTIGAATEAQRTTDLTPIVQELINRPGWTNGNAMAFLISWISGARREAESYEGFAAGAPLLHIEYQQNEAPVVSAGADQAVIFPTATITGTLTDDGVPAAATTLWTKVSGPGSVTFTNASALNTTVTFSISGIYVLRLTATDGTHSASDDITISVATDNQAPIVNAGPNQAVTFPNSATLDGTVTDDGIPAAATTLWTKVSGPGTVTFATDTAIDTTATFSEEGAYVLRLTATDGEFTSSDDITITVATDNQAPIVNAGTNQTITLPSGATLDGTVTDDGVPAAATTTWSKVSGPGNVTFTNASALNTQVSFSAVGDYVLRLTADDGEFSENDDVTITVIAGTDPTGEAPEVNAGEDQTISLSGVATLTGTVIDDGLPPTATTLWTKVSGPGDVTFADASAVETTATFSEEGTYVLRLTATDGELTSSNDVTINVVAEQSSTPSLLLPKISK